MYSWAQYTYLSSDDEQYQLVDDISGVLGFIGPLLGCPDDNESQAISAWVSPEERAHYSKILQLWEPIQLLGNTCSLTWDDVSQWNLNYYKEREPNSTYPFYKLLATFIDRDIEYTDYEKWMHNSFDLELYSEQALGPAYTASQEGVYEHAQAAKLMLDIWFDVEQKKADLGVLQNLRFVTAASTTSHSPPVPQDPQELVYSSLCSLLTPWITIQNPALEGWRLAVADPIYPRLHLLSRPEPLKFKITLPIYRNWLRIKDGATRLRISTTQSSSANPDLLLQSTLSDMYCDQGNVAVQEKLQAPLRGHRRVEQKARKSTGGERPIPIMETWGVTQEVRAERTAFYEGYTETVGSHMRTRAMCKRAQIAAAAAGIPSNDSSSNSSESNRSSKRLKGE